MRLQRGFTLLELLIAIAIFALLALATYRMFDSVMQTDQATRVQEQRMRELVRAMGALERDLTQAVERPVRDELGDNRGAFLSEGENDQIVELTRGGWRNPLGQARSPCSGCAGRCPGRPSNAATGWFWTAPRTASHGCSRCWTGLPR